VLAKLVVENLALIEQLDLDFAPGLVVLSGETGAGKSLVLDALSLILGYRGSTDMIRAGSEKATVQAVFEVKDLPPPYADLVEDGQLIIAREIQQNGRTVARINGQLVTIGFLRDLGRLLVDLHGQHEHQSLLQVAKHREVLDRFAGAPVLDLLEQIRELVVKYRETEGQLKEVMGDERERERRLEMLRYQQEEIAAAALAPDEEEELLATRQRLANYERLHQAVTSAYQLLYGGSPGVSAVADQLARAITELNSVERFDNTVVQWTEVLQDALYSIEDVARSLRIYKDDLTYDDAALDAVERRLELVNRLKRKYADSLAGIIAYGQKVAEEIEFIENSAQLAEKLQADLARYAHIYRSLAAQLTDARKQAAAVLGQQMQLQLADLGLPKAVLTAEVRTDLAAKPHPLGQDEVEFMFNANPGENPKPLTRVISGGEMSRVMLALKTLLAEHDPVETLIFDEIDSGLGGRLALAVGGKLRQLAGKRQVICVSHLASIAAMADQHLLISKEVRGEATFTQVKKLNEQERVEEIARMLDGQTSEVALAHARDLLKQVASK